MCKPECVVSSDCPSNKACDEQRCTDPCSKKNVCGKNARCNVINHNSLCSCINGYTGDPFVKCTVIYDSKIHIIILSFFIVYPRL